MKRRLSQLGSLKVHRCRFLKLDGAQQGAVATAYNQTLGLLAVARTSGQINIYAPHDSWDDVCCLQTTLETTDTTIRNIHWIGDRLVTTALNGWIIEWDITHCTLKTATQVTGAIWGSAIVNLGNDEEVLMVGCEDGTLRVYDINEKGFWFRFQIQAHKNRITCVSTGRSGKVFTSGGDGRVNVWKMNPDGRRLDLDIRFQIDKKNCIVWTITELCDNTLGLGDSLGRTQLWDLKFGTLLKSFQSHQADILCMCTDNDGRRFQSSGIDSLIVQFAIINGEWRLLSETRCHKNDVFAMISIEGDVVSMGVSGKIVIQSAENGLHKHTIQPRINWNGIHVSGARTLLFHKERQLQLWKLGTPIDNPKKKKGESIPKKEDLQHLLDLNLSFRDGIHCSNISPDGRWIACSSPTVFKIFYVDNLAKVTKVEIEDLPCESAACMAFSQDSSMLAICDFDGRLHILKLENMTVSLMSTRVMQGSVEESKSEIRQHSFLIPRSICFNSMGNLIASGDSQNRIVIQSIDEESKVYELPIFDSTHTCLSFIPDKNQLIIACASKEIYIYDLQTEKVVPSFNNERESFLKRFGPIERFSQLFFHPECSSTVFFRTNRSILALSTDADDYENGQPQRKKARGLLKKSSKKKEKEDHTFHLIKRYRPLLFADFCGNELVVAEDAWSYTNLPAPIYRRQFGT